MSTTADPVAWPATIPRTPSSKKTRETVARLERERQQRAELQQLPGDELADRLLPRTGETPRPW